MNKTITKYWWLIIVIGVIAIFGWAIVGVVNAPQPEYFDENSPVMYFYSNTCHYCILQKNALKELAAEGFRVKPMNVGRVPSLWKEYDIKGTPTFISEDGERLTGLQQKDRLREWLKAKGAKIA